MNNTLTSSHILQITNGCSPLSQLLCELLIEIHKCRVALVTPPSGKRSDSVRHQQFNCDLSSRKEVSELASKLKTQFGSIQLVIHQECDCGIGITDEQMQQFVSQTSSDILGYVNVTFGWWNFDNHVNSFAKF